MGPDATTYGQSTRDWVGNHNFMKQLFREYVFPVEVFRVDENGTRELIRVEQ